MDRAEGAGKPGTEKFLVGVVPLGTRFSSVNVDVCNVRQESSFLQSAEASSSFFGSHTSSWSENAMNWLVHAFAARKKLSTKARRSPLRTGKVAERANSAKISSVRSVEPSSLTTSFVGKIV